MMSNKDLEKLAQIMAAGNAKKQSSSLTEIIFRTISSLTLLAVTSLVSISVSNRQNIAVMFSKLETLDKLEALAEKPRFTYEDFSKAIDPVIKTLNDHTEAINKNGEFKTETGTRLTTLELHLESLKKK